MKFADVFTEAPLKNALTYKIPEDMKLDKGYRVIVPLGKRMVKGFVVRVHDTAPSGYALKEIKTVLDREAVFDDRLIAIASFTAEYYIASPGEVLFTALPSGISEKNRTKKKEIKPVPGKILSEEQQSVFEEISDSIKDAPSNHLIFGVTGSGKTEVYIDLAKKIIRQNRSVIFLVPEISLSSQIFERLSATFGDELVIYHSGLTPNARFESWMRFYRGDAKIVIGTRSAVFMQCADLGLIIIDEEHDQSYKEHSTPRYSARRIALQRGRLENASVIMGSATPSVDSLYGAEMGVVGYHRLTKRFGKDSMPEIKIVKIDPADRISFSNELKLAVSNAKRNSKQSLLLLNRRGYSPLLICSNCGDKITCPDCSISMTYHGGNNLVCHYCGFTMQAPEICPKCNSGELIKLGSGTERAEEEIAKIFKNMNIFRLDQDTARIKGTHGEMLDGMQSGDIDLLVGTQMIAKGFDFKKVEVAAVLLADIGLSLPDYRASERIFSLLMQLSGRSGRGEERGKVIIQTFNPDNPIFSYIKNHDYEGWYREELKIRKILMYPPYSRLARILSRSTDESESRKTIEKAYSVIQDMISRDNLDVEILGPTEAPIYKVGKNYRMHIILKCKSAGTLIRICRHVNDTIKTSAYLEIDVDPVDMM